MKLPELRIEYRFVYGLLLMILAVFFSSIIFSCSHKSDGNSFNIYLDEIDACIKSGSTEEALSILNTASKKSYSAASRLSIYKRYLMLGEEEKAEAVLVKGLKALKTSAELRVVYSNRLANEGRYEEALKVAEGLQDTKYSSIYAEAVLRTIENTNKNAVDEKYKSREEKKASEITKRSKSAIEKNIENIERKYSYLNEKYIPTYLSSYYRTNEQFWLQDAATVYMSINDIASAKDLCPEEMDSRKTALFWASIFYDAKDYGRCISILKDAKKLEPYEKKSVVIDAAIAQLSADANILYGDELTALRIREDFLDKYENILKEGDAGYDIIPSLLVNNAFWYEKNDDYIGRYECLDYIIRHWPSYIPGLLAYGNYALDTSAMQERDPLTLALRRTGFKSLSMTEFDNIVKIPVQDAIYLMKNTDNPLLIAIRQTLIDISMGNTSQKEAAIAVYSVLEGRESATNYYPPVLMEYAIERLIAIGLKNDAYKLFYNYLKARYGDVEVADHPEELDYWECEVAAYFAAEDRRLAVAKRLYEYLVYTSQRQDIQFVSSSSSGNISVNAMVNLAMIYSSIAQKKEALQLYSSASSLAEDNYLKAEILYRMACIHRDAGESDDAISVLQYCLNLNPSHDKARQLLRALSN